MAEQQEGTASEISFDRLFTSRKLTQVSVHFVYATKQDLPQKQDLINEHLAENYFPAEVINGPGEYIGDVPVFSVNSQHGFSNILFASESTVMTVQLSENWQDDLNQAKVYVATRARLLRGLIDRLQIQPFFTGIGMTALIEARSESMLMELMRSKHTSTPADADLHEIQVRQSLIEEDAYYVNTNWRNYRLWSSAPFAKGILRFSSQNQSGQGIELGIEVNDRYAFNERPDYYSKSDTVGTVVAKGFIQLESLYGEFEVNK